MHRYDTENERGWERGRTGRREFEGRRWEIDPYEPGENWRGYEGRDYNRRFYENRGYENQGYGDQGAWGQPYSNEYRGQNWERMFGREPYGREGYGGREYYGGNRGRFAGRGPRNYQRSDQRIQEEINDRLTDHPEIDATEIEVRVVSGEVTLGGSVNERFQKRLAEDCAESVGGVKQVHNQIRIQHESGSQEQRKTAASESPQQREMTGTGSRR